MRLVGAAGLVTGAVVVAGGVVLLVVRRRWLVVRVRGASMLPALRHGDTVLARRLRPGADSYGVGDIVVVQPPDHEGVWPADARSLLVKRVAAMPGQPVPDGVPGRIGVPSHGWVPGTPPPVAPRSSDPVPAGAVAVLGDNGGYDSRVFGLLPTERVVGVVVRRPG